MLRFDSVYLCLLKLILRTEIDIQLSGGYLGLRVKGDESLLGFRAFNSNLLQYFLTVLQIKPGSVRESCRGVLRVI